MNSGGFLTTCAAVIARLSFCRISPGVPAGAVFAFALALPLAAQAAPRTFVASTGNDTNTATNCPVTAPCQSFAAAYSVTNVSGEIIALETAGYGPRTITNSVSIIAIQRGFVKVNASSTGITITGGTVILDNIEITGSGNASSTGISVSGGARLILKNSALVRLTTGLSVSNTKVDVINTDIVSNQTGIFTDGTGVDASSVVPSGVTQVRLYARNVMANATAFFMANPGVGAGANSLITILLFNSSDQTNRVIGNTMLINGSGTGCPNGAVSQIGVNLCFKVTTFNTPLAEDLNSL
jgi:hypothetical protein